MGDYLVFDLETQRAADEVGGWGNIAEMKMSVGVLWDSRKKAFFTYLEDQVEDLIEHILNGPRVIGFNHIYFDYPVLTGYRAKGAERDELMKKFEEHPNLDLLIDLKERLGHRLKLDSLVRPTLSIGKSADGLLALQWYKEFIENGDDSKMQMIVDYCKQDVAVTRDLFEHGIEQEEVSYEGKGGAIKKVKVDWTEQNIIEDSSEQLSLF